VYIVVDDMGYGDLGCFGSRSIKTPHLDRMAAEGMRFTQAYSGCTVCAPARSTLMTGHHMGHTSVRLNTGGVPLRDEDLTLAEVLKQAGYATGGFGKWGLGDLDTPGVPEKQGFDIFYGYYHQIHAHYYYPDYLVRNGVKVPLPGNKDFYRAKPPATGAFPAVDPKSGLRRQYTHDLIFAETLAFIRANKDRRFFCYAPWTPPHGRLEIPEADPAWQAYKDKPWSKKARVTAAMVSMVDRQVGEVLALLKELGLDKNTIVFFTSDNGAAERFDGELDCSGPLRGRKRDMYEGGLRAPLIVRWPDRIAPGRVSGHLCYFPDVLPTLAELAGAPVPAGIDGLSFIPELLGPGTAGREQAAHDYLYWEWHQYNWGQRRLVEGGLMQATRMGKWKAVRHSADQPVELYDLSSDVGETRNVAGKFPDVAKKMQILLRTARTDPRPQSEPAKPGNRSYR
jgi:arylsulfatase A-like enzyme